MSAGVYDITIDKGEKCIVPIVCTGVRDTAGALVDLTTYLGRAAVKLTANGSDAFSFVVSNATYNADGSFSLTLSLTPTVTAALTGTPEPGATSVAYGFWALELYSPADADVRRILQGSVILDVLDV